MPNSDKTIIEEFAHKDGSVRIKIVRADGCVEWRIGRSAGADPKTPINVNGLLHREEEDGPAMYCPDQPEDRLLETYWLNGLLHRERGPAQISREKHDDGSTELKKNWAIKGVVIPAQWKDVVERPKDLSPDFVMNIENVEVRRIAIERAGGIETLAKKDGVSLVDVDVHHLNGYRALMEIGGRMYLHCACPSTGRTYFMSVPPESKTCEEADRYLSGLEGLKVRQVGRT